MIYDITKFYKFFQSPTYMNESPLVIKTAYKMPTCKPRRFLAKCQHD